MDKIRAILLYNEERVTFINNLHDFIKVKRDLSRKIKEGSYFKEMEWAVYKGYCKKDKIIKLKILAL
jgi:hypothetical protein